MRGIVLAGGTGSRLGSLTRVLNKHVLPVGPEPMVAHALAVLRTNGCKDITIVSTRRGVGQLAELLGGGYTYLVQDAPTGIAGALKLADDGRSEGCLVVLGDNVFTVPPVVLPTDGARCFLYCVKEAAKLRAFGVPVFAGERVVAVEEKPQNPKSNYAVTGLYYFGPSVWSELRQLTPGARGELEIADLLDAYARRGALQHTVVDGFWGDAGTVEGIAECAAALRTAQ